MKNGNDGNQSCCEDSDQSNTTLACATHNVFYIRTLPARLNNFAHFTLLIVVFILTFFQSKHLERIMSSP